MGAKFSFLEHKADVLFEAYGKTFKECVENSALALFAVVSKPKLVKASVRKVFREKAKTREELIVFLLNRLVGEGDAREVFWKSFKVRKLAAGKVFSVEGTATGGPFSTRAGGEHVKAVTMHEASVKNKGGKWVARILLDV